MKQRHDEQEKLTFLKMGIESFEVKVLKDASRLISTQTPRIATWVYHYVQNLLDIFEQLDKLVKNYYTRPR